MIVRFNAFSGVMPALDPSKLPDQQAVECVSVKFERGNLVPYRVETTFQSPTNQTQNIVTVHRLATSQWLAFTGDVAVARGPMPIGVGETFDADFRIYYAGESVTFADQGSVQVQWPAFTTKARAVANVLTPYFAPPASAFPMGVPAPGYDPNQAAAPTVTLGAPQTGTLTTVTKGNPATFTMSAAPSPPIPSGARVRFSGMPGTGDGSQLQNAVYPVTKISGDTVYRIEGFDSSAWAGNISGTFTWTRVFDEIEVEDRIYCFTYVDQFGQESEPGTNSAVVGVGEGQSVTLGLPTSATIVGGSGKPTFNLGGGAKKRIYRSATGDTFNFLLVAEVGIGQASFVDTLGDGVLGEALVTKGFDLPPQRLHSLVNHPNGFLAGAVDNEAHFSEPYLVYAWPITYRKVLPHKIVGVGIFGSTLVYATEANPVLAYCTDPSAVSWRTLDVVFPCLSRRSLASNGQAVFYVAPQGLVMCSDAGAEVVTRAYWNADQWRALVTNTNGTAKALRGEWSDDSYWLTIDNGECWRLQFKGQGIINAGVFRPSRAQPAGLASYSTLVADHKTNELFGMRFDASVSGNRVLERIDDRAQSAVVPLRWLSRVVTLDRERNFGAVQVFSPAFPPWGITIECIPETGVTPITVTVNDNRPARLPAGFWTGTWQIRVTSSKEVAAVHFGATVGELRSIEL